MGGLRKYMALAAGLAMITSSNPSTIEKRKVDFSRNSNPTDFDKLQEAKGLKQFFYGSDYVWALNQKTADKKAKKKGWI